VVTGVGWRAEALASVLYSPVPGSVVNGSAGADSTGGGSEAGGSVTTVGGSWFLGFLIVFGNRTAQSPRFGDTGIMKRAGRETTQADPHRPSQLSGTAGSASNSAKASEGRQVASAGVGTHTS
jgi:hypothetical protein